MLIEFVYFGKNQYNLFTAQTEVNCVIYRNFLNKKGIEESQYFNDSLPNVYDIADDLLSEYADIICFAIDKENVEYSTTIANAVLESDEDTELVFVCIDEVNVALDHVKVFAAKDAMAGLNELLEIESEEDIVDDSIMPYTDNLLPVKACAECGLFLNKKIAFTGTDYVAEVSCVIRELEFVSKYMKKNSSILLNSDQIEKYPYLDALLEQLESVSISQNILLAVSKSELTNELVQKFAGTKVIIIEQIEKNNEAFINGLQTFLIGAYYNVVGDYTKHIEVEHNEISEELLAQLSVHNEGNSAIYVNRNEKEDVDTFAKVKEMSNGTGFLFTNYLEFHKEDDDIKVDINDCKNAFSYKMQAYSQYQATEEKNSYVSITTRKDMDCFIEDYKNFIHTGKVLEERMWKPLLKDRCRFAMNGLCSVTKLQKMKVKDGEVYPCGDCNKSIGKVNVPHFQLLKKACVEKEKEEMNRKCNDCEARFLCDKCVMLPDFLEPEEYCSLMKNDFSITSYLATMMCVKYVFEFAKIPKFKDYSVSDVVFLTKENQVEISKKIRGNEDYFNVNVAFFKYEKVNAYIGFNMLDRKAFTMNQNMFILCEMLYKGITLDEIVKCLCEEYNVEAEDAKQLVQDGLQILNQKGYLKKEVCRSGVL